MPVQLWRFDRAPSGGDPLATFDDVLRLMRADVIRREDGVTVNLLWSPAQVPDHDYTVSAFVLDANGFLVAQHDSYPLENRAPTSGWQADRLYFDSHAIPVENLAPGAYRVAVKVYRFTDASFQIIEIAPASDCTADPACEFVIIEEMTIQ